MPHIKFEDYAVKVESAELPKFSIGEILKDVRLVEYFELGEDEGEMVYEVGEVGIRDAEIVGYSPIFTSVARGNVVYLKLRGTGKITRFDDAASQAAWNRFDERKAAKK